MVKNNSSKPNSLVDTVKTVVYAVLIALVIRTFGFEPFNIPSGSMIPTLLVGDYLFVSKSEYGYSKHSFPLSLPLMNGRIFESQPKRGDVAVFKLPSDNTTDYIKRIVGLPGDTIRMKSGRLYLNGILVKREKVNDLVQIERNSGTRLIPQYMEFFPNGTQHLISESWGDQGPLDNTILFKVPSDHYFAMGDNRDNSQDSRVFPEVGFIPKKNLVGKAKILFFSTNGKARLWEIWNWPISIRFERLLQKII